MRSGLAHNVIVGHVQILPKGFFNQFALATIQGSPGELKYFENLR
jgi:hypothetical protein